MLRACIRRDAIAVQETEDRRFGTLWRTDRFEGRVAFQTMRDEFKAVLAACPDQCHESHVVFGGARVLLRIIGDELAEHICRPFSHLRIPANHHVPDLTIEIWDEKRGRTGRKVPPREEQKWTEATVASSDGLFVGQRLPHTYSCLDRRASHIMASIAWHDRIFIYERAKPLARLLLEWHNGRGVQIAHAGLVGYDRKGVLFAGKSGSGKSTASLASICAGLGYLSEDYVGLQCLQDLTFVGHSIYNSVFIETSHMSRFTPLAPYIIRGEPPEETKSVIILSQAFPERLKRSIQINALALVRVRDGAKSSVRPASKAEALLTLAPSSLLQIPNRSLGIPGFQLLANLVEQVPCYWLDIGSDFESIADHVRELLVLA